MAVTADIKVGGSAFDTDGSQLWATNAAVVEDATGISLTDAFGGVGSIQATTEDIKYPLRAMGKTLQIDFSDGGTISGPIATIGNDNGAAVLNAETRLAALNRTVRVPPTTTTIGALLQAVFAACGISSGGYSIDSGIAARSAVIPGWRDNAHQRLKEIGAVERFEIADVGGVITVRPQGQITADIDAHHGLSENSQEGTLGLFVETHLYTHKVITNAVVYPPATYDSETGGSTAPGWSPDADVIEVTPGAPVVVEVPIMASLSSVNQPTCVDWVSREQGGSVYTVTTNDGVRAVNPSTWTSRGGKVTVQIMPDTTTLKITVDAGHNDIAGAPYRLMLDDGRSEYSTLRISGTGVAWTKDRLRQRTSVPEVVTDNEIASSTDSIFVRTETQAYAALRAQADEASRSGGSISGSIATLPLEIGRRAGAIVRASRANFRLRTVTTSAFGVDMQGDRYTTVAAHNAAMSGKKVVDANQLWKGMQVRAHNAMPLPPLAWNVVTPSGAKLSSGSLKTTRP